MSVKWRIARLTNYLHYNRAQILNAHLPISASDGVVSSTVSSVPDGFDTVATSNDLRDRLRLPRRVNIAVVTRFAAEMGLARWRVRENS